MENLVYLAFGILALLVQTDARISPINTNNPVAIIQDLADGIESRRTLINALPEIALSQKDRVTELFKRKLLTEPSGFVENTTACAIGIKDFIFGIARRESPALRMLDAWGKLDSGIATGNVRWYGRYHECLDIHADTFSGKYFLAIIGSPDQAAFGIGAETSISIGLCLPETCSQEDVNDLVAPIGKLIKSTVRAYLPVQPTKYTGVDIAAIIISCFLGIALIVATLYDLYLTFWKNRDYDVLSDTYAEIDSITRPEPSIGSQILLSFSLIKNTEALFDTTQKEGNINVLHGMRFISMTWVILGHTFIFGPNYIDNVLDGAQYYISTWQFQAIGNATFSVDSFFFLSGLLAAYLGMREMKKRNGKLSIGLPYLYRYLRLTPAYAFCMLISVSLYSKMGDGPMWPAVFENFKKPCEKYWWTNLLYINNLHPASMTDECYAWGWYLANDMQFFLLSPFILWALFKVPLIGSITLFVGTLFSMIATGVLSSHYKQQPQALGIGLVFYYVLHPPSNSNATFGVDDYFVGANGTTTAASLTTPVPPPPGPSKSDIFWEDIYSKPWCRMGSYFIGMAAGYILYNTRLRIRMGKIPATVGWIVSTATALAVVYGLAGHIQSGTAASVGVAAFYNAVSRQLWSICLAWVVVACCSGYGGPVNSFLSWKVFIPLSRLTYCAYLVHPLVIFWAYGILEENLHFSIVEISIRFLGMVGLSYAVAFIVSVLIEMPTIGLIKATLGKIMGKGNSSSTPLNQNGSINVVQQDRSSDA